MILNTIIFTVIVTAWFGFVGWQFKKSIIKDIMEQVEKNYERKQD
jgi:hypothetical protein